MMAVRASRRSGGIIPNIKPAAKSATATASILLTNTSKEDMDKIVNIRLNG
jgi:hypothetical protein